MAQYKAKNNANKKANVRVNAYGSTMIDQNSRGFVIFEVIFMVLLGLLVFYPPYFRGLYFNKETLVTHIISFLIFIVYIVYKAIKSEKIKLNTILDYSMLGLIIVYLLPIIFFQSANARTAVGELLKYINFGIIFIMISDVVKDNKKLKVILNVAVASAVGVALLGFDAAAGSTITKIINDIYRFIFNVKTLANGQKVDLIFGGYDSSGAVNSTLQYKNACAAILSAAYFVNMGLLVNASKKWQRIIYAILGYVMITVMVLTYSRGVYVLFLVAVLANILLSPKGNKVDSFLSNAAIGIPVVAFLLKINGNINAINTTGETGAALNNNIAHAWLWLLAGIVVTGVLALAVSFVIKFANKISAKAYAAIFAILVVAIGTAAAFVVSVQKPLVYEHSKNVAETALSSQKFFDAKKGNWEIKLHVDAKNDNKKPWAYQVQVFSQTVGDMLGKLPGTQVYSEQGSKGKDIVAKFKIKNDAKKVYITLTNTYAGTYAKFSDMKVKYPDGKTENQVLAYKYLPQSITDKVQDISGSTRNVIERGYFTKDALKVFGAHPIFGAGGGAFTALYFKYQSYSYFTTQSHDYVVQLLDETGVIGFIVYAIFLIGILIAVIKFIIDIYKNKISDERTRLLSGVVPGMLLMILHSFMDFDLALAAMYMFLLLLVAVLNSCYGDMEVPFIHFSVPEIKFNEMASIITTFVLFLVAVAFTVGFYQAKDAFSLLNYPQQREDQIMSLDALQSLGQTPVTQKGTNQQAGANAANQNQTKIVPNLDQAQKLFESAESADGLRSATKMNLATIYLQKYIQEKDATNINKAFKLIDNAIKLDQYNPILLVQAGVSYLRFGGIDKGLSLISSAIKYQPMVATNYEQKAAAYISVGNYYLQNKKNDLAKKAFKTAIGTEKELKDQAKKSVTVMTEPTDMITMINNAKTTLKSIK